MRYSDAGKTKARGVTYTPTPLARFIASRILAWVPERARGLRVLDPAVGSGRLLEAMAYELGAERAKDASWLGVDLDPDALEQARAVLPEGSASELVCADFLAWQREEGARADVVIANPPYVRTQILGSEAASALAESYGLSGRVDLSHAFLAGIIEVLEPGGVAGVIVSNRILSTRAGRAIRDALSERAQLLDVIDLGDTKLFDAAVLPVVLVFKKRAKDAPAERDEVPFTSIYACDEEVGAIGVAHVLDGFGEHELLAVDGAGTFRVKVGELSTEGGIWALSSREDREWLEQVAARTWKTFGELGKIRVGIKSCADKVFIKQDWGDATERPELLRPLLTHHVARRFSARDASRQVLYPHERVGKKRSAVDLSAYPVSQAYLEEHRERLEARGYLTKAGRAWYELWVPHDPLVWARPKLVWRDICEDPTFWVDEDGCVVNGDCYWLALADEGADSEELLWLAAAVANTDFMRDFYDRKFHNKLYASRRRFITQYVEHFPLPDPASAAGARMIELARALGAEPADQDTAAELAELVLTHFTGCDDLANS